MNLTELMFHKSAGFIEDPMHWANKMTFPKLESASEKLLKRQNRFRRERTKMLEFARGEKDSSTIKRVYEQIQKNREMDARNEKVLMTIDQARWKRYGMHPEEDKLLGL